MLDTALAVIKDEDQRSELTEFYSQNKDRFFGIAYSRLHSKDAAEDAVQEAFSEIADKPGNFFGLPEGKKIAYVNVMVRNISVKIFNSKNKISEVELDEKTEDASISLENDLFAKISRDEILAFIDSLPPRQRSVLMLHCLFGYSVNETAQKLKISLTAVKKRLTMARKAVREFVDERSKSYE